MTRTTNHLQRHEKPPYDFSQRVRRAEMTGGNKLVALGGDQFISSHPVVTATGLQIGCKSSALASHWTFFSIHPVQRCVPVSKQTTASLRPCTRPFDLSATQPTDREQLLTHHQRAGSDSRDCVQIMIFAVLDLHFT